MNAISTEAGVGLIFNPTKNRVLDYCFTDAQEADAFLSSAERVGVNLYVGMPHGDLAPVVAIWRDAYKREAASVMVSNGMKPR